MRAITSIVRHLLLSLLAAAAMLQGCEKPVMAPGEPDAELFHVKKSDGSMILGTVLCEPELYLISDGKEAGVMYSVNVSFPDCENIPAYSTILNRREHLKIQVPLSCFYNDTKTSNVLITVSKLNDSELIFRSMVSLCIKEIPAGLSSVIIMNKDGDIKSVSDGEEILLFPGDEGLIRICSNEPEFLKRLDYSLGNESTALSLSGTVPSVVSIEGGVAVAAIRYQVTGTTGGGWIYIHPFGREGETLFGIKYHIKSEDTPVPEPGDEADEKDLNFTVSLPSAIFAGKGFMCELYLTEYEPEKNLNACITIDGASIPMGDSDEDFYQFNFIRSSITPSKRIDLYIMGNSVDAGPHTLDVTLWEEGKTPGEGKTCSHTFYGDEILSGWSQVNGLSLNGGTEMVLDAVITSDDDNREFLLELTTERRGLGVTEFSVSQNAEGFVVKRSASSSWIWNVSSVTRGRHSFTYKAFTNSGQLYSWTANPYFFERYRSSISVSSNKLYLQTSGPRPAPDFNLTQELFADIYAVIPYTEAVMEGNNHVNKDKYEYHYLSTLSKVHTYAKGSEFARIEMYSGLSSALKLAKSQLSKYKGTKNGASRWVQKNGVYTKETYTPASYLLANGGIEWSATEGKGLEYIEFVLDAESLAAYLKDEMELRMAISRK